MADTVKQLGLGDLIFNRQGSFTLRILLAIFGIALKLFFRRIETFNAEVVPRDKPVIFVHNHPNGLIDPALVFVALPRKISFLAKSTLFKMPVIGYLLRTVEALPLYRQIDAGADVSKNQQTFAVARELLKKGGAIALFPEGVSHSSSKVLPAKTGAARIALGTVSMGEPIDLYIVPVGLFYTSKTTFRSEALLHFGEPFRVEPVELEEDGQPPKIPVKALTKQIEEAIREVTVNAETDSELQTARIAERIFAATYKNEDLADKLDFLKNYIADQEEEGPTPENVELREKLVEYDKKLEDLGLEAEHLSLSQVSKGFVIKRALAQIWPLLVLLPIAILGALLHYIPYKLCNVAARVFARKDVDDIVSTVKLIAGLVFIPLTWVIVASIVSCFLGWRIGLLSVPVAMISAYAALYSLEEIDELSGWAKAIWLYLRRKETFLRLFVERRELLEELQEFD
jgi:glycerol-3-phosphate O-acyltransferase / dihydroxyacetone phosphate acyltransferase